MRCLTLAKSLRKLNVICKFVCRDHKNNLSEKIKEEKFEVIILPKSNKANKTKSSKNTKTDYEIWLGEDWKKDATQTINAFNKEKIDWLIIDHYGIDERWERKVRHCVKKIMVIDDLSNRNHDCDLLLDQNLVSNFKMRYRNLVPKYCSKFLGPRYALLQDIYKDMHLIAPPRIGSPKRILVYFGEADNNNLTEMSISAFMKLNNHNIKLDVVISSKNPCIKKIKNLSKKSKNISIKTDLDSLAPLMLKADLALGACGATSWERLCLGLPSIIITIAENQEPIAKELHNRGLIRWLGNYSEISNNLIYDALEFSINEDLESWSSCCKHVTDGCGAQKIASFLTLNPKTKISPRLAQLRDKNVLEDCLEPSANISSIKNFRATFNRYLRNQDKHKIYIIETDEGLPICQVQFNLTKNGWTVNCIQRKFIKSAKLERLFIEAAIYKFRNDQEGLIVFAGMTKNYLNSKTNKLAISICSEKLSWVNKAIPSLLFAWIKQKHNCSWVHNAEELEKGDICFYLSYEKIVNKKTLKKFRNNLVVHASDLPKGKGWSPMSWQILEGSKRIIVTLFEAKEKVDSGNIYLQLSKKLNGYELIEDLRAYINDITTSLCKDFVKGYPKSLKKAKAQGGKETFYPRRLPEDSRLDFNKSIEEQFNLFRIADNDRYPAFFEINGHKYYLLIKTDEL